MGDIPQYLKGPLLQQQVLFATHTFLDKLLTDRGLVCYQTIGILVMRIILATLV